MLPRVALPGATLSGVALHAGSLLLGAVVGVVVVLVHRSDLLDVPLGLVIGPVATVAVAWALRSSTRRRLAASYAGAWLAVFGVALVGRPEGDFAVAADVQGYVLIATALVLAALGLSALAGVDSGRRGSRA